MLLNDLIKETKLTSASILGTISVYNIPAWLLVYHTCEGNDPVDRRPFGTGFPPLPWTCPICQKEEDTFEEVAFAIDIDYDKFMKALAELRDKCVF